MRVRRDFYRFKFGVGWLIHIGKALSRQDHSHWRPFIARRLPRNGVAIDVGAHGGQFTRPLSGAAPDGLVIAVEPSSYARSILRIALWFRGARNVLIVATGLGERATMGLIRTPIKRHGDVGYGLATLSALARASVAEPVAVVTLDEMAQTINLPALHLIKADIEGFETALIAGGAETIEKHKPAILLEMSAPLLLRAGSSLSELWGRMVRLGYASYRLPEDKGDLVPCPGKPVDGDIVWLPADGAKLA
jgi:FkbM family methyltransferase